MVSGPGLPTLNHDLDGFGLEYAGTQHVSVEVVTGIPAENDAENKHFCLTRRAIEL
jgi:hypothetical protein